MIELTLRLKWNHLNIENVIQTKSTINNSNKVAKPSLNQISDHHFGETKLPNQW